MEHIAQATTGPKWFQLYMNSDVGVTRSLLQRAKAAGFSAIILTADALGPGASDEFIRLGRPFPAGFTMGNYDPKFGGSGNVGNQKINLTPDDIGFIREVSGLPVVVKGIMRGIDAEPLREAVASFKLPGAKETLALHTAERWRDRLIAEDDAFTQWMGEHPGTDAQALPVAMAEARILGLPASVWPRILAPLVIGVAVLGLWEFAVRWNEIPHYVLPGPILVGQTLVADWGTLSGSLWVTLKITFMALAAAVVVGVTLAVAGSKLWYV